MVNISNRPEKLFSLQRFKVKCMLSDFILPPNPKHSSELMLIIGWEVFWDSESCWIKPGNWGMDVVNECPHKYSNTSLHGWFSLLSPRSVLLCSLHVCRSLVHCCLHTVVGFVRDSKTRQTHTLIGAHCVNALSIFTQWHPTVQLWALVHVCGQKKRNNRNTHILPLLLHFLHRTLHIPTQAMWDKSKVYPSKQSQV